jgi:hypothetical protein
MDGSHLLLMITTPGKSLRNTAAGGGDAPALAGRDASTKVRDCRVERARGKRWFSDRAEAPNNQ